MSESSGRPKRIARFLLLNLGMGLPPQILKIQPEILFFFGYPGAQGGVGLLVQRQPQGRQQTYLGQKTPSLYQLAMVFMRLTRAYIKKCTVCSPP